MSRWTNYFRLTFGAVRDEKYDFKLEVIGCRKDDDLVHLRVCLNPSNSLF
jgi:hypothetical protein